MRVVSDSGNACAAQFHSPSLSSYGWYEEHAFSLQYQGDVHGHWSPLPLISDAGARQSRKVGDCQGVQCQQLIGPALCLGWSALHSPFFALSPQGFIRGDAWRQRKAGRTKLSGPWILSAANGPVAGPAFVERFFLPFDFLAMPQSLWFEGLVEVTQLLTAFHEGM